jgi:uncharacterized protein (DUF58 family)
MRGWQALLLALIAGSLGLATGSRPLQMAVVALVVIAGIGLAYRYAFAGDVQCTFEVSDDVVGWGEALNQNVTVTNSSRLRIPAIRVTDESTLPEHPHGYVATLGARRSVTWEIEVPCQARGRYRLGPVVAHMSDPLGLFPTERQVSGASSVLVLPRWVPLRRSALKLDGFMPGEARGRRRGESPPAVVSVREYATGDSIAAIHWPASARASQLMTKLFDPEIQTSLWLALDLDGAMDATVEELLVTTCTSLALYGLRKGALRVGLVASGALPAELSSERGRPQQYRLQEVLAEVHAGTRSALADQLTKIDRQLGVGHVVVLLTQRGPDVWADWLQRLARRGVGARVVYVSEAPMSWPVHSVQLTPALANPAMSGALVEALEHGTIRYQA